MKWFLSTMFIMIFMITLVSAQPPFAQPSSFVDGFELKYPIQGMLKQAETFDLHFHVFNISNGVPINSGINCSFHLYNSSGKHILQLWQDTPENTFDYEFTVNGSYITDTGYYSYITQCNNSDLGGFVSVEFEVAGAKGGMDNRNFIAFLFLFASALLIFGIIVKNQYIGFIAALLYMVGGIYMLIYGYGAMSDLYTRAVGFSAIGIGALVALSAAYTTYKGAENEF